MASYVTDAKFQKNGKKIGPKKRLPYSSKLASLFFAIAQRVNNF